MSQVRIYGHREHLTAKRKVTSDTIQSCLVDVLGLPPSKRFQRFIGLNHEDFIHPDDRSDAYTIIEISMFAGRSRETRKRLIRLLFDRLERDAGINPQDVEITIYESPAENWGIRGRCGDELVLDYDVKV